MTMVRRVVVPVVSVMTLVMLPTLTVRGDAGSALSA